MRWLLIVLGLLVHTPLAAQELAGLARVIPSESKIADSWWYSNTRVRLGLSQYVPYAVSHLNGPNRVVLEFNTLVFDGLDADRFVRSDNIEKVSFGAISSNTSRLVLHLAQPMLPVSIAMTGREPGTPVSMEVVLTPVIQSEFDAGVTAPDPLLTQTTPPVQQAKARPNGDRKWIIALDPGHGGIDPGADGGRRSEADLMLMFAFELQDQLRRTGLFDVMMTRTDDSFVGLENRMSLARAAGADVFISLHADAVVEGVAVGSTVYTLSQRAGSQADAKLAARHNNADILAGVDLRGQGDEIAQVLLDLVRRETEPRAKSLADSLIQGLKDAGAPINSKPRRNGDFAVLRSADIPSVLLELGFLSSQSDVDRLNDPAGRKVLIQGIVQALETWTVEDAAAAALIRQ